MMKLKAISRYFSLWIVHTDTNERTTLLLYYYYCFTDSLVSLCTIHIILHVETNFSCFVFFFSCFLGLFSCTFSSSFYVKICLQKYRLHTRRPSPSLQTGAPTPQLVVFGGIWVPPEYARAAAHSGGPTLCGPHPTSHVPPPHYCAPTPMPQEFYNSAPSLSLPSPAHENILHHHHFHMYKTAPQTRSSPVSDVRSGGDRSETIEDGKSESGSWKAENGEKKGLAALRDQEGDESTGSEITLKF